LLDAFRAARSEKHAAVIARTKPDPAGGRWVAEGDEFAQDRTVRMTDKRAAADPLRQQLQMAIRSMAAEMIDPTVRLSNSRTWGRLSATAAAFHVVMEGDPLRMPERLGDAYALLLRLGRFLETDIRVQRDSAAFDDPLDADIHGLLTDLVRTAAPWLRGFPTVAAWDDAAGKALVRADLFQPAREFARIARAQLAISEHDAAEMELLADAADASDYQGQKAGNRAVASAKNLMLAAAGTVAAFLSGAVASDFATRSLLVQRAGATLASAEAEVDAFAATLPGDLRQALRALVREGLRLNAAIPEALPPPSPAPNPPVPDDVEAQARAMILDGRMPPATWRPFIHQLVFDGTTLDNLNLLAGLTNLQRLSLSDTQVSDVTPLAGLTNLQILNLSGTQVSDVAPLAGLTALQSLDLTGTRVAERGFSAEFSDEFFKSSDLTPLAGLTALRSLDLTGTQVSDVAPLTGLTALQSLNLSGTQVSDVAPLAGLTALRGLDLANTQVSDLAPLAGLTNLQRLDLGGTQVSDVSPLAGLTALHTLGLAATQVSDVTPLASLSALRHINLHNTQVSDLAPLAHIRDLKILR
jgi:hypothetical protein